MLGHRTRWLLAVGLVALASSVACSAHSPSGVTPGVSGVLILGEVGNSRDTIDPYTSAGSASIGTLKRELYDGLTVYDNKGRLRMALAESITHNAALTQWTVRLRPGIELHDGQTFDADDVISSVKAVLDPATAADGAALIDFIDPKGLVKIDDRTVLFRLKRPTAIFAQTFASEDLEMRGLDRAGKPVGTGPFVLDSFTPGQEADFTRFAGYWGAKPGFAKLRIVYFQDQQAITNALLGGQINVAYSVPFTDLPTLKGDHDIRLLISPSTEVPTFMMRLDRPPFDNPKVQQALKLVVNRTTIIANAYGGYATVGNDYIVDNDPSCPNPSLPQRRQNIAEAKALLAQAGESHLSFEIATDGAFAGMTEAAELFSQEAAQAGITVTIRKMDTATFLGRWGQWPFFIGLTGGAPYEVAARSFYLPGGPNNARDFSDTQFTRLYDEMQADPDPSAQCRAIQQMEKIDYERGGQIIPAWPEAITAYRSDVHGLQEDVYSRSAVLYAGVTVGSRSAGS